MQNKIKKFFDMEHFLLILFLLFTLGIIVTSALSSHNLSVYSQTIQEMTRDRLIMTAKLASYTVTTGEELDQFVTVDDMQTPEYSALQEKMRDFADENDLLYIYFIRYISDDVQQFIIDSDPEAPLGLEYTESPDEHTLSAFNGNLSSMEIGEYSVGWEGIIAAYAPIYNANGDVRAIVGVDIEDTLIAGVSRQSKILSIVASIETCFVILFSTLLLMMYRKKAKAYEYSSVSKSIFLSRMSHEIRTPMNAIIGFCRMANETDDMNNIRNYLDHISNSSTFLLQLINSILDISKIEAGKLEFNITPNSIIEMMTNVENMFLDQAKYKNIDFKCNIDADVPNHIYCDKTYLTQVIVNLTSNALKFTPDGGQVYVDIKVIESSPFAAKLRFKVKDTGIGIKKENISKVFEAFEQGDNSKTRKYGGTGLGLNISKLLIDGMGGSIHVESQFGKGSTFYFDLWLTIVNTVDMETIHDETCETNIVLDLSNKNLLLVEDNEINQIIALNALEEFNAKIDVANNGKEGLEMFLANPDKYYLIIMDIQMPEMDGYETTRKIRSSAAKNAKDIPIIAMSANVFKEDIDASIEAGMNAHIGKPFDMEKLKETILKVMR